MSIKRVWRRRKVRRQAAVWHTRIGRRLTITQRRAFDAWLVKPDNATEFHAQHYLLKVLEELKGAPAKDVLHSVSSEAGVKAAKPPATQFVSALRRSVLSEQAYRRIVGPLVAQEQHEYYEAMRRGEQELAWWIGKRIYLLILWNTFWVYLVPRLAKLLRGAR